MNCYEIVSTKLDPVLILETESAHSKLRSSRSRSDGIRSVKVPRFIQSLFCCDTFP